MSTCVFETASVAPGQRRLMREQRPYTARRQVNATKATCVEPGPQCPVQEPQRCRTELHHPATRRTLHPLPQPVRLLFGARISYDQPRRRKPCNSPPSLANAATIAAAVSGHG